MIFVRNLKMTYAGQWGGHTTVLLHRELLRVAGWTEISLDGAPDPAFAASVIVDEPGGIATGFQVAAANPNIIVDQSGVGRFTAPVTTGMTIFLRAVNDQNKGGYRIQAFIDANHALIDSTGAPVGGWINESDMPARIISNNVTRLADDIGLVLQAPAPSNLQVYPKHVYWSYSRKATCYVRPKGGAGVATNVSGGEVIAGTGDTLTRFNAVIDGKNAIFYYWNNDGSFYFNHFGELDSVDTGDVNPGFIWNGVPGTHIARWAGQIGMLNQIDGATAAYPTFLKALLGTDSTAMYDLQQLRRLHNGRPGKLLLHKPKVVMTDVASQACLRGKLPLIRFSNAYLETARPLDAAGSWLHLANGLVVPRNGPNDPLPLLGL